MRTRPQKWFVAMPAELARRRRIKRKLRVIRARDEKERTRARWMASFRPVINPFMTEPKLVWWGQNPNRDVVHIRTRWFHVHPFTSRGGIFCSKCGLFKNQHNAGIY